MAVKAFKKQVRVDSNKFIDQTCVKTVNISRITKPKLNAVIDIYSFNNKLNVHIYPLKKHIKFDNPLITFEYGRKYNSLKDLKESGEKTNPPMISSLYSFGTLPSDYLVTLKPIINFVKQIWNKSYQSLLDSLISSVNDNKKMTHDDLQKACIKIFKAGCKHPFINNNIKVALSNSRIINTSKAIHYMKAFCKKDLKNNNYKDLVKNSKKVVKLEDTHKHFFYLCKNHKIHNVTLNIMKAFIANLKYEMIG